MDDDIYDPGYAPECQDCQAQIMHIDENGVSFGCYEEICILEDDRTK